MVLVVDNQTLNGLTGLVEEKFEKLQMPADEQEMMRMIAYMRALGRNQIANDMQRKLIEPPPPKRTLQDMAGDYSLSIPVPYE